MMYRVVRLMGCPQPIPLNCREPEADPGLTPRYRIISPSPRTIVRSHVKPWFADPFEHPDCQRTALPGGGICLKNFGLSISATHDVIVRYLRVRPGDKARLAFDAVDVGTSHNVIIDHCSTSWAIDETLSISSAGSNNVTVQWCFITESLHDSYHPKGPHGMGSLLRTPRCKGSHNWSFDAQ